MHSEFIGRPPRAQWRVYSRVSKSLHSTFFEGGNMQVWQERQFFGEVLGLNRSTAHESCFSFR